VRPDKIVDLVGLDWDSAAKGRLDAAEASWAESASHARQLGWALLPQSLELLSGHLGQETLNNEQAVEGVVALQLATLGQVSAVLGGDDVFAQVVAGDGVLLLLDVVGGGDGDAAILGAELNLALFGLEALDVEAQVQHARAIESVDVDGVREGPELSHGSWAEDSIADARVEAVPRVLVGPVRWGVPGRWDVATEGRGPVPSKGRWDVPGRWEVAAEGRGSVPSEGRWDVPADWKLAPKFIGTFIG